MASEAKDVDYSLNNPDTLTKYKMAGEIAEQVLDQVSKLCVAGDKFVTVCEKGDRLIEEAVNKVYKGKKVNKGFSHPVTVSPSTFVTPYSPMASDEKEAGLELQDGEMVKIQLGVQIDGFGSIVCDTVLATAKDQPLETVVTGRKADLMLATYYANELLLRLMIPPGLLASGTNEEKAKAASAKPPTQSKMTSLLEKVVKSFECNLVEGTTSWLFGRNEIEDSKKIVLAPGDGSKGDGVPEVGEVWGVEMGVSLGSGKMKQLENRATLHRRTMIKHDLTRPTSRKLLTEVQQKFGNFPFSLRQLENERDAKMGAIECVRTGVFRQYEVVGEKDNSPVARLLTTIVITKNGITKLGAPPVLDLSRYQSDKKIEDGEILHILEQPLSKNAGKSKKNKKKKKKPAKKAAAGEAEEDDDSDDE